MPLLPTRKKAGRSADQLHPAKLEPKTPASHVAGFASSSPASRSGSAGVDTARELSRGVTENGSLARTTSTASKDIIRSENENVNSEHVIYRTADTLTPFLRKPCLNRAIPLLRSMGLQICPTELQQYGSICSISYNKHECQHSGRVAY